MGTEDMDSLTFGASIVLRHLTFSEARCGACAWCAAGLMSRRKMPIKEFNLAKVLSELELTMPEVLA